MEQPYISNSDICEFEAILADYFPEKLTLSALSNLHYFNTQDPEYQRKDASWAKGDYLTYPVPPPPMIPYLSYQDLKRYGVLGCLTSEQVNYFHQKLLQLPDSSIWHFSTDANFPQIPIEEYHERVREKDAMFFQYRRCSIPLFSPDRQRVLFFIEYLGNVGCGWIYIFQRAGKDWQEVYADMIWIS